MADSPLPRQDTWASGKAYEPYVGRWSRGVAREFLAWLTVPAQSRWLDVGCGTGALTEVILDTAAPGRVTGIDRSTDFAAFARQQIPDQRADFGAGDAQRLPVATAAFDAIVSGLALNFVPQPQQAVAEMVRAAKPRCVVAAYVWDYAGKLQFLRHFWNAAAALDPSAYALDEGRRFPICHPTPLRDLFRSVGLGTVEVRSIDIATDFRDFEDYWTPFLGGQGPAPSYTLSLNEAQQARLQDRLRASLPFALDGSIPLSARAWAVRGIRG